MTKKEKIKNPLFLQPNRSFDFGINLLYQYTVSSTHLSPFHNRKKIVRIQKIYDPLKGESFPESGTNTFLTFN